MERVSFVVISFFLHLLPFDARLPAMAAMFRYAADASHSLVQIISYRHMNWSSHTHTACAMHSYVLLATVTHFFSPSWTHTRDHKMRLKIYNEIIFLVTLSYENGWNVRRSAMRERESKNHQLLVASAVVAATTPNGDDRMEEEWTRAMEQTVSVKTYISSFLIFIVCAFLFYISVRRCV